MKIFSEVHWKNVEKMSLKVSRYLENQLKKKIKLDIKFGFIKKKKRYLTNPHLCNKNFKNKKFTQ